MHEGMGRAVVATAGSSGTSTGTEVKAGSGGEKIVDAGHCWL